MAEHRDLPKCSILVYVQHALPQTGTAYKDILLCQFLYARFFVCLSPLLHRLHSKCTLYFSASPRVGPQQHDTEDYPAS